jgi:hypothetical protein
MGEKIGRKFAQSGHPVGKVKCQQSNKAFVVLIRTVKARKKRENCVKKIIDSLDK